MNKKNLTTSFFFRRPIKCRLIFGLFIGIVFLLLALSSRNVEYLPFRIDIKFNESTNVDKIIKIFLDTGRGFNEKEVIEHVLSGSSNEKINFNYWGANIKGLRFLNEDRIFNIKEVSLESEVGKSVLQKLSENLESLDYKVSNTDFNQRTNKLISFYRVFGMSFVFYLAILAYPALKSIKLKYVMQFLTCSIVIYSYLFLFYMHLWPGVLTADSLIVKSINRIPGTNYKPFIYNIFLGTLSTVSGSPKVITLTQIFLMSILTSSLICYAFNKAINRVFIALFVLIAILSPLVPLYIVTIWKNVEYSMGLVTILFLIKQFLDQKKLGSDYMPKVYLILLPLVIFVVGVRHSSFFYPFLLSSLCGG